MDGHPTGAVASILRQLRRFAGAAAASAPDASGARRRRTLALLAAAVIAGAVATTPAALSPPAGDAAALGATGRRLSSGLHRGGIRPAARIAGSVRFADGPLSYLGADGEAITAQRIRRFLARHGSPMARYSHEIVAAGLRYRVDPRVVVAIAGVESTYGLYAYGHNAWGWGGSRWRSWPDSIDGYTQALSRRYRSLRTGRFAAASRTYCPPCGARWGVKALQIFRQI